MEFQLLQEENISSTRPIDNIDQEEETTDMNIINNRNRLTIRQFTKNYLDQKSQISIGEKRSPDNASFGKISPFSPIQAKIDEKGEKSTDSKNEVLEQKPIFNNPLISEQDLKDPNGYKYDPEIINNITRFNNSDQWFCKNKDCKIKGDKWVLMKHNCNYKNKKELT